MAPSTTSACMRSKLRRASSRWASAAVSCACSSRVSSSTSTSPCLTARPDSNEMRATRPGRSALTVTPCTAAVVPMTASVSGHSSGCATIVVTASGGGWNPAAWLAAAWNCWNLTNPSTASTATVTVNIRIIRFAIQPSLLCPPLRCASRVDDCSRAGIPAAAERPIELDDSTPSSCCRRRASSSSPWNRLRCASSTCR